MTHCSLLEEGLYRQLHPASHSSNPSLSTTNEPTLQLRCLKNCHHRHHPLLRGNSNNNNNSSSSSWRKRCVLLSFQFSVNLARRVTRRNLPYLWQSWTHTNAVSVVSFWITFVLMLTQTGVEYSAAHHIGVFRALGVLRTARLLSIASDTVHALDGQALFFPLHYHALV